MSVTEQLLYLYERVFQARAAASIHIQSILMGQAKTLYTHKVL